MRFPRSQAVALAILCAGCSGSPKSCTPSEDIAPGAGRPTPLALSVAARAPKEGEPTALEGGGKLICAQRFQDKRACAGSFGWKVRDPATGEDELYGYSDLPVVLDLPYNALISESGVIAGEANGRAVQWFADAADKSPKLVPWVGAASSFTDAGFCGVLGKRARCYTIPECGEPPSADAGFEWRKLEFGFPSPVTSLASNDKSCVSLEDGTVHCWGEHFKEGSDAVQCIYDRSVQVEGLTDVVSVARGPSGSVCALRADGSVVCWGRNDSDQFGVPEKEVPFSETPMPVPGLDHTVRLFGADSGIAALQADGAFYYWGHPIVPDMLGKRGPQKAELPLPAVDLLVMSYGVCALLTDRSIRCVGGRFDRRREKHGPSAVTPFEGLAPWVDAKEYEVAEDFPLLPPELRKSD